MMKRILKGIPNVMIEVLVGVILTGAFYGAVCLWDNHPWDAYNFKDGSTEYLCGEIAFKKLNDMDDSLFWAIGSDTIARNRVVHSDSGDSIHKRYNSSGRISRKFLHYNNHTHAHTIRHYNYIDTRGYMGTALLYTDIQMIDVTYDTENTDYGGLSRDSLLSIKIEDRGWVRVFSQHSGDTTIAKICLLDGSHKPIYNKERLFNVIEDFF